MRQAMQLKLFQESHEPDREALKHCLLASIVSIDVETETRWPGRGPKLDYGLSYPAEITLIGLAWLEEGDIRTTAIAAPFDMDIQDFLISLFQSSAVIVAHNAVFDMRQLSKLSKNILPKHIWDTQSMARLLHPAVNLSYSLLSIATELGLSIPERQQSMKTQRSKLHTLPLELSVEYVQDDARLTLQIYQKQQMLPADSSLIDWECRAVREYCLMAAQGIRLNSRFVEQRLIELRKEREKLAMRLAADGLASPGSSKARAKYLYETKGIPLPKWDPKSWYFTRAGYHRLSNNPTARVELSDLSTRSGVIESYLEEGSPYFEQLRDLAAYSEVDWLVSTLQGLLDHAVLDGRLHSLVTTATESGRRASSYPHMQNWKMPAMAGVAIGDEGFTLVEIDYNNAENVMAALISGDSNLAAACATDDFHTSMALQYFGREWEDADADKRKHLRTMSKKISYGTAYGMGAERLGASIGLSKEEARRLIQAKDAAFAKVTQMRTKAQREVEKNHLLHLWTGRPVAVPSAFVAWNYLCQGGVSEMLKRAIVLVSESYRSQGMRSRVALDMHDALILEIAHEEWETALTIASQIMSNIPPVELSERTNPPIRFVAQPKLSENQHKWGAEQWHPAELRSQAMPSE
jgi:DNA polymerase I-like protein with 3'-5' exonuclease and polymerase domains